ncbi:RING finger protein [Actinidia chinensis var. chinensis]|uniref:RING finger protein n=1 Tax=Actinidia chinensis var. chinensis TaxID=1590841 RepID=A0A2R6PRR3_ACTCC|nr:RING finger protein [Actinidia chinensis var. chinensis]
MKISSKSILSPGRPRDPPVSLSTSLSRRLRSNRSLRGGQSPMFPTGGKKRFENPEPSSPKVTCIGQVRVKTKQQGNKMRNLSNRRGNEVSFRRIEQIHEVGSSNQTQSFQAGNNQTQNLESKSHRNQRWVHLPLTICEALRGIGAEFSCLFPCASARDREKELGKSTETREGSGGSSCGGVFARWLVAGREIELVVGGQEERRERGERSLRRHVGEEREIDYEKCEEGGVVVKEEEARVSICIPPKNALLLMRCKSDPMRVSALANRFWESADPKDDDDDEEDEKEEVENGDHEDEEHENLEGEVLKTNKDVEVTEKLFAIKATEDEEDENPEADLHLLMDVEDVEAEETVNPEEELDLNVEFQEEDEENQEPLLVQHVTIEAEAEEIGVSATVSEAVTDPETLELDENAPKLIEEEERRRSHQSSSVLSVESDSEDQEEEKNNEENEEAEKKSTAKKETQETATHVSSESEETHKEGELTESLEGRESEVKMKQEIESGQILPDCLLMMMCEPKLSMEVSKETWVCSTDFIRWLPERRKVNKTDGRNLPKNRIRIDANPPPPRSSCSLPATAAVSMAAVIEQKLAVAAAYEPLVLKRCKSEPMRTAPAKLAPETCFWKNRKLEPHRRATLGFSAAWVGF